MKTIDYNKAAYAAYTTLSGSDKVKADKLINAFAEGNSVRHPSLSHKINKVVGNLGETLYSIRLTPKLRILVEDKDDRVIVADILNHDLFVRYFHNVQAA